MIYTPVCRFMCEWVTAYFCVQKVILKLILSGYSGSVFSREANVHFVNQSCFSRLFLFVHKILSKNTAEFLKVHSAQWILLFFKNQMLMLLCEINALTQKEFNQTICAAFPDLFTNVNPAS